MRGNEITIQDLEAKLKEVFDLELNQDPDNEDYDRFKLKYSEVAEMFPADYKPVGTDTFVTHNFFIGQGRNMNVYVLVCDKKNQNFISAAMYNLRECEFKIVKSIED